jgi:hypothetical protein
MTENSAIFNARLGAGSFHPHRQAAPTAQDCLKRGNGANWRTTRQLSGECRFIRRSFRDLTSNKQPNPRRSNPLEYKLTASRKIKKS